jgi:hypothetical protein
MREVRCDGFVNIISYRGVAKTRAVATINGLIFILIVPPLH